MTRTQTHQELEKRIKELKREAAELKRAGGAIREAEKKYRTLFDESKDAIYITSREGKFLDINHALLELFGYSREETIRFLKLPSYVPAGMWLEPVCLIQGKFREIKSNLDLKTFKTKQCRYGLIWFLVKY